LLGTDGANSEDDFQQIHKARTPSPHISPYLPISPHISLLSPQASTYAEIAFDQMQLHADLEVGRAMGDMGEM